MRRPFDKRVLIPSLLLSAAVLAGILTIFAMYRARDVHCLAFSDGTRAYFRRDTKVVAAPNFPQPRVLYVDGQLLLITAAGPALTVQSRLMSLTVTGGSTIRVIAYSGQTGEQVEVLQGNVTARKAYRSSYTEPDRLGAGEMSMVNQQIDLMEKETANSAELRNWAQEQIRAAHGRCPRA